MATKKYENVYTTPLGTDEDNDYSAALKYGSESGKQYTTTNLASGNKARTENITKPTLATGNTVDDNNPYGHTSLAEASNNNAIYDSANTYNWSAPSPTQTYSYDDDDDDDGYYGGGGGGGSVQPVATPVAPSFTATGALQEYKGLLADIENAKPGSYQESDAVNAAKVALDNWNDQHPNDYVEGDSVKEALAKVIAIEAEKPDPYQSRYEGLISDILNKITNKDKFDVKTDSNYNYLYDQYKDSYQAQAQRAMKESIANAQAMSGGYGSSYAQSVGQQAYDQTMQGLNDNNINLMNLAYGMYQDNANDQYNQLNAVNGLENRDYSRYRDTVGDWENERNYLTNRYDNERNIDYSRYRDTIADWENERNYLANRYDTEYSKDYGQYRDNVGDWQSDRDYAANRYDAQYAKDWDAYKLALSLAEQGYDIPDGMLGVGSIAPLPQMKVTEQTYSGGSGGRSGSGSEVDHTKATGNYTVYRNNYKSQYGNYLKNDPTGEKNYYVMNLLTDEVQKGNLSTSEAEKVFIAIGGSETKATGYTQKQGNGLSVADMSNFRDGTPEPTTKKKK